MNVNAYLWHLEEALKGDLNVNINFTYVHYYSEKCDLFTVLRLVNLYLANYKHIKSCCISFTEGLSRRHRVIWAYGASIVFLSMGDVHIAPSPSCCQGFS